MTGYILIALVFSLVVPVGALNAFAAGLPTAGDDSATTNQGIPVTIDILMNDQTNGRTYTVNVVTPPSQGTLSNPILNSQNKVVYTPNVGFSGTDSFQYTITNPTGTSNVATVTITVIPGTPNLPPVAVPDYFTIPENAQTMQLDVLANDHDPENNPITIEAVGGPQHGSVQVTSDHKFITYQPFSGYFGIDNFTYTITDGHTHGIVGNVGITISQVNHPPTADNLNLFAFQNNPVKISLSGSDPDSNPITFSVDTLPSHGTLNTTSGKYLAYTPNLNYVGQDMFTYHTNDGSLNSNPANVIIHVTKFSVTITTPSGTTNVASQTISGNDAGNTGASVTVYSGNTVIGTTTIPPNGKWDAQVTLLEGSNVITATESDSQGHVSLPSNSITITLDTIQPLVAISSPNNNAVLNTNSVTVTGTTSDNLGTGLNQVTVSINNGAQSVATLTGNNWSFSTSSLVLGSNTITATSTDNAGNSASTSITVTVSVYEPVITTPSITTTNPSQTITGTATPGATVNVYSSALLLGTITADSSGNWSIAATLASGANTITATATIGTITSPPSNPITITILISVNAPIITTQSATTTNPSQTITGTATPGATVNVYSETTLLGTITADSSGNWSITAILASGANTITATATIDTITSPPSSPITITVAVNAPIITTQSATTTNPSQTITGTATPGATVNVYSETTLLGTATADSSGNWSITAILASGANTITATATIGTIISPPSSPITITVAVNAPVITTQSATTTNPSQTITGTATPGATVSVYSGTALLGTATADGSGNWNVAATLASGANTITATATLVGIVSPPSNPITITVAVNAPVITTQSATTTHPSQTITGTATPGSTVNVYSSALLLGTITADSSGNWSITATLASGANTITATATIGTITSPPSNPITITIIVSVNAPIITTPSATTTNPSQTITGTATPGATVNVYTLTSLLGTATADGSGNWSVAATLASGANTITATATIGTIISPPSNPITIIVSVNAPVITTPSITTTNPSQTITGTATPGAIIKVYSGATLLGTATADGSGNWSVAATLASGANTITATATIGTITSPPSSPIIITVGTTNTSGKTSGSGALSRNTAFGFFVKSSDSKTFLGSLDFNDKSAKIDLDSTSITSLAVDSTHNTATFSGTGKINGKSGYTFTVTVADKGGVFSKNHDTFSITISNSNGSTLYTNSGSLIIGNITVVSQDDHHDFDEKIHHNNYETLRNN